MYDPIIGSGEVTCGDLCVSEHHLTLRVPVDRNMDPTHSLSTLSQEPHVGRDPGTTKGL